MAQNPGGTAFKSSFYLWKRGLGKTHLANAIGIDVKNNSDIEKTVLYHSAYKFQTQFVDAIMDNRKNDKVHFYQSIDVLIIDDVQFLCGKEEKHKIYFFIFLITYTKTKTNYFNIGQGSCRYHWYGTKIAFKV